MPAFQKDSPAGRNFHFGVREHAMGSILNGMAVYGGLTPYGATFLVFADYMRAAVRLAALSHYPSIFIFTHDSVGLGEDLKDQSPPGAVGGDAGVFRETGLLAWRLAEINKPC